MPTHFRYRQNKLCDIVKRKCYSCIEGRWGKYGLSHYNKSHPISSLNNEFTLQFSRAFTQLNASILHPKRLRSTNEGSQESGIIHRKQKLPPYPQIEVITELQPQSYLPSNFKSVRYGDHEFKQCPDGYVHIFVQAYKDERSLPSDTAASFVVYYGENHAL